MFYSLWFVQLWKNYAYPTASCSSPMHLNKHIFLWRLPYHAVRHHAIRDDTMFHADPGEGGGAHYGGHQAVLHCCGVEAGHVCDLYETLGIIQVPVLTIIIWSLWFTVSAKNRACNKNHATGVDFLSWSHPKKWLHLISVLNQHWYLLYRAGLGVPEKLSRLASVHF